jgi:hypothetical protein
MPLTSSRKIALVGAISALIFAASLVIVIYQNQESASSEINYPASDFQPTAETTNATIGLEFIISINPTIVGSGDALDITMTVRNTLSTVDNVTGESDWNNSQVSDLSTIHPGCLFLVWDNFVILKGYYTYSNITSASRPLWLIPRNGVSTCPALYFHIFSFQPRSSNVTIIYQGLQFGVPNFNFTSISQIKGYYPTALSLAPFPLGVYTLAAGDEWGQLAIVNFRVTPNFHIT